MAVRGAQKPPVMRDTSWMRRRAPIGALLLAVICLAALLWALAGRQDVIRHALRDPAVTAPPRHVGSHACAGCHQKETGAWTESHHAKAMQHATPSTVLGNFNDVVFEHSGVRSRMFRAADAYLIETDGPDGRLQVFEVKYTFGFDPLQQYLVEFPDGRLQALPIAWDARAQAKGGQRWFHLYPSERIDFQDELHWTKASQNWNFMCAECHSTGVRKNYDAAQDTFRTTFAEISVGCEACHGRGSRHVAWARSQAGWRSFTLDPDPAFGLLVQYAERLAATWPIDMKTGSAKRSLPPPAHRTEVETCGLCHARRGPLSEDWRPGRALAETHSVSLLSRGLYDAAGQMEDEVFNYGSFRQSKMYAEGVTCSNCHEPHAGKLRIAGDGVCLQCHLAEKFADVSHNGHQITPPPTCANCHMPVRTYMGVDNRHDHGFSIPRPDRSARTGTRNACNDCHTDRSYEWTASAIERWHGASRKGFQTYADAFSAARAGAPGAAVQLRAVAADKSAPAIARATALLELARRPSAETVAIARASLAHSDPLLRGAALDALEGLSLQQRWPIAWRLLEDSVLSVRVRAASFLASPPSVSRSPRQQRAFDKAAADYVAAQTLSADRPDARVALGTFHQRQGRAEDAETQFRGALRLDPRFAPASISLAELYRQTGRDNEALSTLKQGVAASAKDASLWHALGLALVRAKAPADEAIQALARAVELAPQQARFAYVHAVALHSFGQKEEALRRLRSVAELHPDDFVILGALAAYAEEAGDFAAALDYTERLISIDAADARLQQSRTRLRQLQGHR